MSRQKVYNVYYPRKYFQENEEKTEFVRVGVAFPMKNADGLTLELSVPLMLASASRLVLMVKEQHSDSEAEGYSRPQKGGRR